MLRGRQHRCWLILEVRWRRLVEWIPSVKESAFLAHWSRRALHEIEGLAKNAYAEEIAMIGVGLRTANEVGTALTVRPPKYSNSTSF